MRNRILVLLLTFSFLALASHQPVYAATFTLTCDPDPLVNGAALVAAVGSAASTTAEDTINLSAGCTYTLNTANNGTDGGNGLPLIIDAAVSGKLTLNGNGATINRSSAGGTPQFRILEVLAGADVTLNSLTFSNGASVPNGIFSFGGAIVNVGSLTITNSTFTDNSATGGADSYGGAIHNFGGVMSISNSTFSGNSVVGVTNGYGGAVLNAGTMTFSSNTVSGNSTSGGDKGYGGGIFNNGDLTVSSSTVAGNIASSGNTAWGGGIINGGTLNLNSDTTISGNTVSGKIGYGAGIYSIGTVTMTDTLVSRNSSDGDLTNLGGGIYNGGTMSITNSVLSGNSISASGAWGGGLYNNTGTLNIISSTLIGNSVSGSSVYGGGIFNDSSGTVIITSSKLSDNTATGSLNDAGGGIANSATLKVINSTISGNSAAGVGNYGGGIYNAAALTLSNSTLSGNSGSNAGGIFTPGTATLNNSIIANSTGGDCVRPSGTVDARNSLIEEGLTCVNGTSSNNLTGDPLLNSDLTLKDNSPARDTGDNSLIPVGITTDLAGNPRIINGTVDRGAFEFNPDTAGLTLNLTLQGRPVAPDPAWVVTAHIQIRPTLGGASVVTGNYASDDSGQITLQNIPPGDYNIWVKGTHTLARLQAVTLVAGGNDLTTLALLEGDADNNNAVNISDFSILAAAFGKASGGVGYDARADFNGDTLVNINDFSLLASHFGQVGAS